MNSSALVKRAFDTAIAGPALIVSLPLQGIVAILVRRRLGSPVLFRQRRPGLHGEPFEMVKFRTMLEVNEAAGLVTDAERMTPFGARLRATSLDELPTLWNIVKGDMSLVGPRPLLMRYLGRYTAQQARRHNVKPGITGLAQVNGRNNLPWEDRLALDVAYVDHHNMLGDISIIATTLRTVLRREGINATGETTMPEYIGLRSAETLPQASI